MSNAIEAVQETYTAVPKAVKAKTKITVGQLISIVGLVITSITATATAASAVFQITDRLDNLEADIKMIKVTTLQNRLLTLEIAKELANKIDESTGRGTGLTGVDIAIKQTQAELDRIQ